MKQFVCLSGLPRSGSTLLSTILDQNPLIHAEGNSAVCQFVWDMHQSGTVNADEQLQGNRRTGTVKDLLQAIPEIYYKDRPAGKDIVVDKCRSWTCPMNVELLKKYIDPQIKIIVLERSVKAILQSFVKLYRKNNWSEPYIHAILQALLVPNQEPLMRSLAGIEMAKKDNAQKTKEADKTFLFVQYDELMSQPTETLARIYAFCGWAPFTHTFTNLVNRYPENDDFYGLQGFHTVRSTLQPEESNVVLPDWLWGVPPQAPP
jgi:sulfotransferase